MRVLKKKSHINLRWYSISLYFKNYSGSNDNVSTKTYYLAHITTYLIDCKLHLGRSDRLFAPITNCCGTSICSLVVSCIIIPQVSPNFHWKQQSLLWGALFTCFCCKICFFTAADPFSNKAGISRICKLIKWVSIGHKSKRNQASSMDWKLYSAKIIV